MKEDSFVRCQHITTTKLLNPETTIRHYVTKCTLYITDSSGKTVAEAQNWNGGSLYWAAQQKGTYTIVREVQVVDVVRSILVTQEKYSVANERDGEPFYDETLAYVHNLKKAGCEAHVDVFHGNIHGFDSLFWTKNAKAAKRKLIRAAGKYM